MKNMILIALALGALSSAACRERKAEERPDYESTRRHSESSHQALDKETKGY
jgi:hypothetical protein